MKRLPSIIACLIIVLSISSCMQMDGYIGHWFGNWKIRQITIDSEPDSTYQGNIFWRFQSDIIGMAEVYPYHDYTYRFGTWTQDNDTLIINYTYTANNQGLFQPLPASYIPYGISKLRINKLTSKQMELTYVDTLSRTIHYSLIKQ